MTDRKKPGVAFWATVVLVVTLVVAYPLSFVVVFALDILHVVPESCYPAIQTIYAPLIWLLRQ